ncbi:MAG: hypothetical protein KAG61_08965 [Bacteriovoracaceae bacterium]|nr:hypothetical protein [Bacteriovoracaceae bacterium]
MNLLKKTFAVSLFIVSILLGPLGAQALDFHELIDGVKKLRETSSFSNGKYIQGGFFASAIVGADQQIAFAALGKKDNKYLAAYCIGGQSISSSAGVGLKVESGQTLGCSDTDSYSGGFLSISIGGQFIFGASVSYSFGADVHKMLNFLSSYRANATDEDKIRLKEQISQLMSFVVENNIPNTRMGHFITVLSKISPELVTDQVYDLATDTMNDSSEEQNFMMEDSSSYPSIGQTIRLLSTRLGREYKKRNLEPPKHALNFVDGITTFFTGCDSIGSGADVGISAGAGPSIELSSYKLLAKVPYKYIKKLTPSYFESVPDVGHRESIVEIGKFVKKIATGSYRCAIDAQAETMGYLGHMKRYQLGKNY